MTWRKLAILVAVLGVPLVLLAASVTLAAASTPSPDIQVRIPPPVQAGPPAGRDAQAIALPEVTTSDVRLVSADERGVVLELLTPEFQIGQSLADGNPCQLVTVAGYGATDTPGWPRLPVKGAMVGVPARAKLTLTVLESDVATAQGRYDVCPVSHPIAETDLGGEIEYGGEASSRDAQAYASDSYYPASLAEVVSSGLIRSQPVAQLQFHPLRYNPVSGELQYYRRIRVRLDFGAAGVQAAAAGGSQQEEPFDPILRATLMNYEDARRWQVGRAPLGSQAEGVAAQGGAAYKLSVNEDGIYQVTYAQLQAAGVPVSSLDPSTLRLTNREQAVAISVAGEADGSFDPGDYLLFYGQKLDTKYTDVNVYWLTWGGAAGPRMPALDGTPGGATVPSYFLTTRHMERNDGGYSSNNPSGPDGDRWYWNAVRAPGPLATQSYTTTLKHVATDPLSATIRGLFKGYNAIPWHHTLIYLNGHLIDNAIWPPQAEYSFEVSVPQAYLVEGTNTISVTCPLDGGITTDVLFVNWFEIAYYHTYIAGGSPFFFGGDAAGTWELRVGGFLTDTLELFDVTTPASPTRILNAAVQGANPYTLTFQPSLTAGHRYVALSPAQRKSPLRIEEDHPSDLQAATNRADYIIITHGDFYTDALRLADYWADRLPAYHPPQSLSTTVVDVQDVYDEFNYGIFDPEAIRSFLAHAYAGWAPPAPAYVLLVGDGNYDFRNNYGRGELNYIPPYMADVDPEAGEVPADNRYVTVSGDDNLPDMHIGRLPVKTSAEAGALVTKILNYEQDPPGGGWSQRALFVADNNDAAGDFFGYSDAVANHYLPAPYTPDKIYYGNFPYTTGAAARTAIIGAINDGRLVVNYVGHGSNQFWASEYLLRIGDIAALTNNTGRLPLMAPMTCLEGYFAHPSPPGVDMSCLAEGIVRAPAKGAIASWSPTGLGLSAGHDFLDRGLFEALFFDGVDQIGPATTQAKLYLYSNTGDYHDLLDTYVLFGDPALQLAVLKADLGITKTVTPAATVQPGDTVTYTLTYANAGPATAYHVVITDTLPEALHDPSVTWAGAVITPRVGSRFAWDVADLAVGEGGVITITAVASPTRSDAPIANTATITATVLEINTANNSSAVSITAKPHNLYLPIITKSPKWDWWW
jgi:uncharacterized repeat protein (TIGR01451 family)